MPTNRPHIPEYGLLLGPAAPEEEMLDAGELADDDLDDTEFDAEELEEMDLDDLQDAAAEESAG